MHLITSLGQKINNNNILQRPQTAHKCRNLANLSLSSSLSLETCKVKIAISQGDTSYEGYMLLTFSFLNLQVVYKFCLKFVHGLALLQLTFGIQSGFSLLIDFSKNCNVYIQ